MLNDIVKEVFFTPEEIAEKLKLSTATVYKLIGQDNLPHFRIGKSYRIPASSFEAFVMSEGNLARFSKREQQLPAAATRFVKLVRAAPDVVQRQVLAIVLFGSYARGDFTEGSDIDLLVIVKRVDKDIEQQIAAFSSDAMADGDFDEFLSPVRMSLSHWNFLAENGSPLYDEIKREGIVLWSRGSKLPKGIASARTRN